MPASVLVVDDSPTALKLVAGALREAGYDVLTAMDGEQAVESAVQHVPDLIVLDVLLPRQNGFEVCRRLRGHTDTARSRILLLTNKSHDTDREWGLKQGADGYLVKPVSADALLEEVARMLTPAVA
jgi:DNA-binding response OmpR family regulator